MSLIPEYQHDRQAVLDYNTRWVDWLEESETISSVTAAVSTHLEAGLPVNDATLGSTSHSNGIVTTMVTAVSANVRDAIITHHVTTSEGRQEDQSFRLRFVTR